MEFLTSSIGQKSNQLHLLNKPCWLILSKIIAADFTLRTPCRVRCRMNAYWIRKAVSCNLPHATSSSSPSPSPEEQRRRPHFGENVGRQANAKVPSTTHSLSPFFRQFCHIHSVSISQITLKKVFTVLLLSQVTGHFLILKSKYKKHGSLS